MSALRGIAAAQAAKHHPLHGIAAQAAKHPLHGVTGRFLPDGSTEYRKGSTVLYLFKSRYKEGYYINRRTLNGPYWEAPTRKDAIERIEYLLTRKEA